MSRAEHISWCKDRALRYVEQGELANAVSSMISDLGKHLDTAKPVNRALAVIGMLEIQRGPDAVRAWIEGFN